MISNETRPEPSASPNSLRIFGKAGSRMSIAAAVSAVQPATSPTKNLGCGEGTVACSVKRVTLPGGRRAVLQGVPPPLDDLLAYLGSSPSPYHAVANAELRLAAAGFTPLDERASWSAAAVSGRRYVVRGGALIAWVANDAAPAERGLRIIGAHTDSPNLRVKPNPDTGSAGWRQLGVEVYGGLGTHDDLGVRGTSHYVAPTVAWTLANGTAFKVSPAFGVTSTVRPASDGPHANKGEVGDIP